MKNVFKSIRFVFFATVAAALAFAAIYGVTWYGYVQRGNVKFGVNFSTLMARQLALDPKEVFDAVIDDLGAKLVRLPVYWSDIEPERGQFVFNEYDYFITRAAGSGAKLILAVGRKLPRWPECHMPQWAYRISEEERQEAVEKMIVAIVERYRSSPAVEAWQVENEPFHVYGSGCAAKKIHAQYVEKEIETIRSLDSRPVMLTDSGEQGWWASSLRRADILGVSMYLQVWNDTLKVVRFPLGPGFYVIKNQLYKLFYTDKKIIVSELQGEPWGPGLLPEYDIGFQKELMNRELLRRTVDYARRTDFDTFYWWGAEWWFWLKEQKGDPSLWNEARGLFQG